MKTKTILTYLFVLGTISMLIRPISAVPSTYPTPIENSSVSTSFDSDHPSYSKIAMVPSRNYPFNVHVEGDLPGDFTYMNYLGTPTTSYTTVDEKGYPTSLGSLENWDNNPVENPWNMKWLNISNDDLPAGETASYNISLSSMPLGTLSVDTVTEFDTRVASTYLELDLIVEAPGLYILYVDSETTLSSIYIINPNGTDLNDGATLASLPAASYSNSMPIRQFSAFMADSAGTYKLFCKSNTRYVTFELKATPVTSEIQIGERIIYKDEDYENIDPASLTGSTTYFPIQLYSFPVTAGDYLRLNFAQIWGSPGVGLLMPSPTGYVPSTSLTTGGIDSFQRISYSGTAYVAVLHPLYFTWSDNGVTKEPLYYKFGVYDEGIPRYNYTLGTNEVYKIDPMQQKAILKFNVSEPTSILLNWTVHQKGTGTTFAPNGDIFLVSNETGFSVVSSFDNLGSTYYQYNLVPGNYQIFLHSTSTLQSDVIEFETQILARNGVSHKSFSKEDNELVHSETTQMESSYFFDDGTYSTHYPSSIPFSYDDSIDFGYNVSLYPSDNPTIFNRVMPTDEIQVWLYNGTEYINQTYNPDALDLFVNGSANSHFAYFGAIRPFNKIEMDLQNISSSMNYTWEYLDDSFAWEDLALIEDGTNATGSTLGQSGLISFEFAVGDLGDTANPDGGGGVPNVNKSMYWFRIACNDDNPTSIPAISGFSIAAPPVQMTRYARLNTQLTVETNFISNFDDSTLVNVQPEATDTLDINTFSEFDDEIYSVGAGGLYGSGDALISLWFYQLREYDYNLSAFIPLDPSLAVNYRVATYDDNIKYKYQSYGSSESNPINLNALNYTTYNSFGYSGSFNGTLYDGVILTVEEGEMYDWYQFILQSQNCTSPTVNLMFDNIWVDNLGPASPTGWTNLYALLSGANNNSVERGIGPSSFRVKIDATAAFATELIRFKLNIATYRIQVLQPNVTLAPIPEGVSKVPSWVLPTSIGGGVAIIAIIGGVVIYKKKNPI